MPRDEFDYTTWALRVAAMCLESDVSTGFAVADSTPNPEKAVRAVQRVIKRLNREADRRDPGRTV